MLSTQISFHLRYFERLFSIFKYFSKCLPTIEIADSMPKAVFRPPLQCFTATVLSGGSSFQENFFFQISLYNFEVMKELRPVIKSLFEDLLGFSTRIIFKVSNRSILVPEKYFFTQPVKFHFFCVASKVRLTFSPIFENLAESVTFWIL